MSNSKNKTALVIGANGGIGREVTNALLCRGWHVRALVRKQAKSTDRAPHHQIDWCIGDAMSSDDVLNAARGTDVIVHAVNPPGYRNWEKLALPMLDNTIRAAIVNKSRIVLPGTVYNFSPNVLDGLTEDSPQQPHTRKGIIRAKMEKRIYDATLQGARALILRAGDYFGASAGNNWFSQCLVKPGRSISAITYPGPKNIGHQWAYLPDVAETMVRLLDHDDTIDNFARFHMEGHWDHDGMQMINAIRECLAPQEVALRRLPWGFINLLRPFSSFCREVSEVRYLWQTESRMENSPLISVLGTEPHTDLNDAVLATLTGLGCITPKQKSQTDPMSQIQPA
ncbi:NAD(P)H-binding protein [Thalassospira sp. HF15]|uniref:NAD(P)H-binding protein n=1 Tax=Thalassospira sp. HF15 TaxID=2722755 RepID=UPI00142F7A83|nr:NAD(P)H-binding protein [Thalassospira sp. HF15]NIY75970.1 NAD(P)H-binding protein [Thalassospira sp. HF15]